MMPELLFVQACGLVFVIALPVIGLTFLLGILAVRNNWPLKLVSGIPLSIATCTIFSSFGGWSAKRG
jgi:hypothetical protein